MATGVGVATGATGATVGLTLGVVGIVAAQAAPDGQFPAAEAELGITKTAAANINIIEIFLSILCSV